MGLGLKAKYFFQEYFSLNVNCIVWNWFLLQKKYFNLAKNVFVAIQNGNKEKRSALDLNRGK